MLKNHYYYWYTPTYVLTKDVKKMIPDTFLLSVQRYKDMPGFQLHSNVV